MFLLQGLSQGLVESLLNLSGSTRHSDYIIPKCSDQPYPYYLLLLKYNVVLFSTYRIKVQRNCTSSEGWVRILLPHRTIFQSPSREANLTINFQWDLSSRIDLYVSARCRLKMSKSSEETQRKMAQKGHQAWRQTHSIF